MDLRWLWTNSSEVDASGPHPSAVSGARFASDSCSASSPRGEVEVAAIDPAPPNLTGGPIRTADVFGETRSIRRTARAPNKRKNRHALSLRPQSTTHSERSSRRRRMDPRRNNRNYRSQAEVTWSTTGHPPSRSHRGRARPFQLAFGTRQPIQTRNCRIQSAGVSRHGATHTRCGAPSFTQSRRGK
jgi:hypothetical protein